MNTRLLPLVWFVLVGLLVAAAACQSLAPDQGAAPRPGVAHAPINAVLGDISFVEAYGKEPDDRTSDLVRLDTHLHYIEERLRAVDTTHLSDDQRRRRLATLNALHAYHSKNTFPASDSHPEPRRPTFLSDNGQVCAVGALVKPELMQALNRDHKHDYIRDIHAPELARWAHDNGLTVAELAMIQPTYSAAPQSQFCVCTGFDLSSASIPAYRLAVERALTNHLNALSACSPQVTWIDFEIAHSGQAFRIDSDVPSQDRCLRAVLRKIPFPRSCGTPTRSIRIELGKPEAPVVAYRMAPDAARAYALCENPEDPARH